MYYSRGRCIHGARWPRSKRVARESLDGNSLTWMNEPIWTEAKSPAMSSSSSNGRRRSIKSPTAVGRRS
jgi:hypothetical protein